MKVHEAGGDGETEEGAPSPASPSSLSCIPSIPLLHSLHPSPAFPSIPLPAFPSIPLPAFPSIYTDNRNSAKWSLLARHKLRSFSSFESETGFSQENSMLNYWVSQMAQ